jgi:hypothetical protein
MNENDTSSTPTAALALEALRQRIASRGLTGTPLDGVRAAEISAEIKKDWISSGMLVSGSALIAAWGGCERQALERKRQRHELVSLKSAGKHYYPAAFLALSADSISSICKLLQDVDPIAQVIFWARPHGAIGGKTLEEALTSGASVASVSFLARAFAEEHLGR